MFGGLILMLAGNICCGVNCDAKKQGGGVGD